MQGVYDASQSQTGRVVTQGQPALSSDTTGLDSDRYLCEEKKLVKLKRSIAQLCLRVSSRSVYFQSYSEGKHPGDTLQTSPVATTTYAAEAICHPVQ